jgi:hypothetical protein
VTVNRVGGVVKRQLVGPLLGPSCEVTQSLEWEDDITL